MSESLAAFLPVVLVLVLTPGVNNVVVLGSTLAAGRRGGTLATAGTSLGVLVWAAAAALGLGALVTSSNAAWRTIQWVGAASLLVLGVRGLLRARRPPAEPGSGPGRAGARGSFVRALATSALNPRAAVTAVAVLPQFVAPGAAPAATTLVLGVVWAGLTASWNLVGVALVLRGRRLLTGHAARQTLEAFGGCALVGTAVSVLLTA